MKYIISLIITFILISCTLEPKYKASSPIELEQNDKKSKIKWNVFFKDEELQKLIETGLSQNRDLRIAYLNIESAKAMYGVQRSYLLPSVNAVASQTRGNPSTSPIYKIGVGITAYELDLFGRIKSLKKSAEASILGNVEAKNIIEISLISEIASTYFQVLTDTKNLEILEEMLSLQEENYKMLNLKHQNGLTSSAELLTLQLEIENAKMNKENATVNLGKLKNALSVLLGSATYQISPKTSNLKEMIDESLLNSVPSEILLERPDVKRAEYNLKSANANIGVARAAFFPSISITGFLGFASNDLSNLFSNNVWSFIPSITMPIFAWGKNKNNLNYAEIQKDVRITEYEKAIQVSFKETLDALMIRKAMLNQVQFSENISTKSNQMYDISKMQFESGLASKTTVNSSKINLLLARKSENTSRNNYLQSLITLYKTMGDAEI
jgi:multidrug efflux system outer membrane protein